MGTHNPTISNYFNRTGKTQRLLVSEETYSGGINYTDNVLAEGSSKMLINYILRDSGSSLSPRYGIKNYSDAIDTEITYDDSNNYNVGNMHFSCYNVYTNKDNINVYTDMCFSFGKELDDGTYAVKDNMFVLVQDSETKEWKIAKYTGNTDYRIKGRKTTSTIHDFNECTTVEPVCCVCNGQVLFFMKEGTAGKYQLSKATITENVDGTLSLSLSNITPKQTTISDVENEGMNLLLAEPYLYKNKPSTTISDGRIMPYEHDTYRPKDTYSTGDTIDFVCYYTYDVNATYTIKWEVLIGDTTTTIQEATAFTPGDLCKISYTPSNNVNAFTIQATIVTTESPTVKIVVQNIMYKGESALNTLGNYDLATATHMISINNMLLLWGVTGAENILYASLTEDVSYFPDANYDAYDEQIIAVETYLNNIIVISTKKVYLVSITTNATSNNIIAESPRTILHDSLGIQEIDVPSVKSISNMVFFRTNNKYYVIVPVAKSGTYTLKVLECHTGIQEFTEHFAEKLQPIMQTLYGITPDYVKLLKSFTYVDATDAKVVYTIQLKDNLIINVILSYNVNTYIWMMEIHQANYSMIPYKASDIRPILYYTSYKDEDDTYKARVVGYDSVSKKDEFSLSDITPRVMQNYQYLDTGSRDQDKFHKKRYRELDLNMNNRSGKTLTFALDFKLDGQVRQGSTSYAIQHNEDPESEDFGLLTYVETKIDNISIPGKTVLNQWELDSSKFPELDKVKVRFKISGKGNYCQYVLVSRSEEDYELLNHVWVCRPMFAR